MSLRNVESTRFLTSFMESQMIRRLSYTFLFFGVLSASAASAMPVDALRCMHWCGAIGCSYDFCVNFCLK